MNQKTRYFLIGSGLVVVVGLCTGLVASYSSQLPGLGSSVGPSELTYLPSDSSAIAFADVNAIMNSQFRERLRQFVPTGTERDRLLAETGIDIERDIDTVVAGLGAGGGMDAAPVIILRGRFDAARIEALATQHGGTAQEYQGTRMVRFGQSDQTPADEMDHSPMSRGGVAFLETGLLAIGEVPALERAIDAATREPDVTGNAALMDQVADIQRTGNAWIVGRFEHLANAPHMPEHVRTQLPAIEWLSVSADIDQGIGGFIRAQTADEQAAEDLRAIVNGALAAARLAGGQDQKFAAMLQSLQSTGTGRTVQLSFQLGPEIIDLIGRDR
jgi:hypothetical protein